MVRLAGGRGRRPPRAELRRYAAAAGIRRRFAPHQLRHAHAVELAREGVPLPVIQRQLGHSYVSTTSVYLQGIDVEEIIGTIYARTCADDARQRWSRTLRPSPSRTQGGSAAGRSRHRGPLEHSRSVDFRQRPSAWLHRRSSSRARARPNSSAFPRRSRIRLSAPGGHMLLVPSDSLRRPSEVTRSVKQRECVATVESGPVGRRLADCVTVAAVGRNVLDRGSGKGPSGERADRGSIRSAPGST
jgi:hypothetical protein